MLNDLSSCKSIVLFVVSALAILVHGAPLAQSAPATTLQHDNVTALAPDYISAWSTALGGAQISSTTGEIVSSIHQPSNPLPALAKRVSPLGQTQYVAIRFRKARWYISIVTVLNTWAQLPDPFTQSADIATSVAQSSRQVIGAQHGRWAVAAWSFFSDVQAGQFTCVSRLVFPNRPNLYDLDEIRRFAVTLATAWGIDPRVPYFYPVNGNLKRDDGGFSADSIVVNSTASLGNSTTPEAVPKITIYSNWTPTQELADQLIAKFDKLTTSPKRALTLHERTPQSGSKGTCGYGVDTARRVASSIPQGTAYDEGCLGSLSDFA